MVHGEYAPLELLPATDRLDYDDYRAWREGRLEILDVEFADGKREVCAWLEAAQSWACAIGLLRKEEANKFRPARDDRGGYIRLKGSTTKGGRPREVLRQHRRLP